MKHIKHFFSLEKKQVGKHSKVKSMIQMTLEPEKSSSHFIILSPRIALT